jgi:hypothetical protein
MIASGAVPALLPAHIGVSQTSQFTTQPGLCRHPGSGATTSLPLRRGQDSDPIRIKGAQQVPGGSGRICASSGSHVRLRRFTLQSTTRAPHRAVGAQVPRTLTID